MTEGALFQITKYTDEKKMSWQIQKWRVWNFKKIIPWRELV